MKSTLLLIFLGIVLITFGITGCYYSDKNITQRSQLWSAKETGPITVLTADSSLYTLDSYTLTDSTLIGIGKIRKKEVPSLFHGNIKLTEIKYIHARESDFLKSIIAVGGIAAVGSLVISNLNGTNGATVTEDIRHYPEYSGGGSSCPYIYSWNGNRFILDGEAFGIAFGKSLELCTSTVLSSLKTENKLLKIKISNERPETHYINKIELTGVETNMNAAVHLDEFNNAWAIYTPVIPLSASDNTGKDVLEKVLYVDNEYWESNNIPTVTSSNFDDIIELNFINHRKDASLILTAINTEFSQVVFKNVFEFLGDQSLSFLQSVENNPEMINSLQKWIVESSMKVSLWNGSEWKQVGLLHPEATAVPFSRVVRVNGGEIKSDTIKIQLSCLADVWKLDRIQIDWTPTQQLIPKSIKIISAIGPNQTDYSAPLAEVDDNYTVLLPPESIELNYEAIKPETNKKMVYILGAQGYLHEWFPQNISDQSYLTNLQIPAVQRIDYLNILLGNKSMFLPPIYAEWAETKPGR
ncbi:MAG: hypothetical protein HZB59_12960 [Ignavibacteriales bacterium]|nr:hypothetical protein [Ignavibacteriales bacterium]